MPLFPSPRPGPPDLTAGLLRARLLAVLLAAVVPLAAYVVLAAEAARHASLDWLETELRDAAVQAASGQAEALARAGRLLRSAAPGAAAEGMCAALQGQAALVPASAVAVHRADASLACAMPAGAAMAATHVPAALAASGAIVLSGDPGLGLVVALAVPSARGASPGTAARGEVVLSLALDPAGLAQLGLPLRRDLARRRLLDPDEAIVLAAQPDHAARAGQAVSLPRLLSRLRAGARDGVEVARDAAGERWLGGFAILPPDGTGLGPAARAAMLIELPYDALLAEADRRRGEQWLAAGALAALGVALAWLLAGPWLVRPLLQRRAAAGAAGEASHEARALAALRPAGLWLRHQGDLAAVADAAGEMFLRLDEGLRVTYASPATGRLLGYAPGEVMDAELAREPGWEPCLALVEALRRGESAAPVRILARSRDDAEVALEVRASRLGDGGFVLACRDVGAEAALQRELEEARARLAALALSDPLTGLANRRRFDEVLGQELARARRSQEPISLVLMRLEDWPSSAVKLGPGHAEAALRQIGQLLTGALRRPGDFAARLDDGLFAVLLPTTDRIGALRVGERVRAALTEAWRQLAYAGLAARIGAGSVLPVGEDVSPEALLELAVRALREETAARGAALLTARPVPEVMLRGGAVAVQGAT